MIQLARYRTHKSVDELKATEKAQISKHKLTGNVRKVYEKIVGSSFGNLGACKLKSQTIADDLGISRSTVTRCIKKLKDLHVIEVINDTKSNGIKGANIYAVIFLANSEPTNCTNEMNHRATHENTVTPTVRQAKHETESLELKHSFNLKNNFVVKNVNAHATAPNVKEVLKSIYSPHSVEGNKQFEELCQIAFGRLKQYVRTHNIPYLQMVDIITNCMRQLVAKQNVRNQFALYSSMIKRQVEQLFEQPVQAVTGRSKELVPEWLQKRDEPVMPSTNRVEVDFEAERQKILAKLQGVV